MDHLNLHAPALVNRIIEMIVELPPLGDRVTAPFRKLQKILFRLYLSYKLPASIPTESY